MEQTQKDNIIKKLIDTHTTVSTMESCTSGMIASTITDTEGASAIFPGGYVTYLNETKIFIGGTTGNIDPNNADSMQGVVYFCIRVKDKENTFEVHAEVAGMNRHEIKQMYTDMVFEKLQTLVI